MEKASYVYILGSDRYGTLYTGVTADLVKRIWIHKQDLHEGFTKKYGIHKLVWFESHLDILAAIKREKQIKKWERAWKVKMISLANPTWRDLYNDFTF